MSKIVKRFIPLPFLKNSQLNENIPFTHQTKFANNYR